MFDNSLSSPIGDESEAYYDCQYCYCYNSGASDICQGIFTGAERPEDWNDCAQSVIDSFFLFCGITLENDENTLCPLENIWIREGGAAAVATCGCDAFYCDPTRDNGVATNDVNRFGAFGVVGFVIMAYLAM